jgi:hypothetical protein
VTGVIADGLSTGQRDWLQANGGSLLAVTSDPAGGGGNAADRD